MQNQINHSMIQNPKSFRAGSVAPQACSFKLCVHIYPARQVFMWCLCVMEDAGDTERTNQHTPERMLETQRANQHAPGRMLETQQTSMPPGSTVLLPSDEPEAPSLWCRLSVMATFLLRFPFVSSHARSLGTLTETEALVLFLPSV